MRSIFSGLNQIEQFRVLDINREREKCLKIFKFSLSSLSSLSPPETLSSFSPPASFLLRQPHRPARVPKRSPNLQLFTSNHQRRRTASEAPGSAARNRAEPPLLCKLRPLHHRADLPSAHPHLLELQVASIWVGRRARSSDRRPRAASPWLLRAPPSLHGGAANHLGWLP